MQIIPAIDLRGGRCVRLRQGRKEEATVYDGDPLDLARRFAAEGAEWLHVVDLDGAFSESSSLNRAIIRRIARECGARVQTGGGVRSRADVAELLDAGLGRVVVGTLAVEQPDLLARLAEEFGARLAVGIDARDGLVVTRGWETAAAVPATELARRVAAQGVKRIVYTDTRRDGMLQGVNLEQPRAVAQASGLPVTASGGVSAPDDLARLKAVAGVDGVIVGKALYENRFTLAAALEFVRLLQ
jgi:phosphoribosylformimino-5-aminoimidazole carboxamide ribotide isomerase